MTTTTLIIVNGALVLGLLAALTLVMSLGHRVAGPRRAELQGSEPFALARVRAADEIRERERAA